MTRKVVSGVLALIGILALSAGAAQAGSGGVPFPLTSFFVCNGINGDAPDQVAGSNFVGSSVDISVPGIGPFRTNVRLGNGALACAVAKLFVSGTNDEIQPVNGTNNKQLVCYNVSVSTRNSGSPHPTYSIINQFFPGTDTGVQDNGIQFICAPSKVSQ